jgi:hypothetical protein
MGARSPDAPTHLGHGSKVARRPHRTLLANYRGHAFVQQIDKRHGDFKTATGVAMRMDIDSPRDRRTNGLHRDRITDPGRMVVYQEALELLHLLVIQHHLGKFSDAGIGPVHDFMGLQFVFEHRPADLDPFQRPRVEFHFFPVACDADQLFDCQRIPI